MATRFSAASVAAAEQFVLGALQAAVAAVRSGKFPDLATAVRADMVNITSELANRPLRHDPASRTLLIDLDDACGYVLLAFYRRVVAALEDAGSWPTPDAQLQMCEGLARDIIRTSMHTFTNDPTVRYECMDCGDPLEPAQIQRQKAHSSGPHDEWRAVENGYRCPRCGSLYLVGSADKVRVGEKTLLRLTRGHARLAPS